MALKPEDPGRGFRHGTVVAFINEKMARHLKGTEFYLENLSLSWEEIEDKIRAILENSEVPSEAQVAYVWGSLSLGRHLACRQGHLQGGRVQSLHDFAKLHKSATNALVLNLNQLIEQQGMECKEAAFQLHLAHTKLAQVQKERDLLRWKLVQAVR
ncbi:Testis-expressed sequence 13B protein [Heterocephalus glaber]|uniref:Testis-expressed sequence 13B protein n=1 Tax=Heterocephalus glaber TaxID=10181 RepID=G5BC30_HETGA|nr:Testis-expressed sequence 13B protein [Heterocephalus glaber]